MKTSALLNICFISLLSTSLTCNANQENDKLNLVFVQNNIQNETDLISLDAVYQIPSKTYHYLDNIFTTFYKKITFNTEIAQSTFQSNAHYELIAIPLIAENEKGLKFELFGNFTNPVNVRLSNLSTDQTLSTYYSNTEQLDLYQSELSLGAGFSFKAGKESKIKLLISNNDMPGYGKSRALVGFETSF
ncbi:hypothetical protein ACLKMH_16925 [Psychromonas sp. KJ10-10]|uniref:hypothetical protein n=1 Tax=Psychromonas sp. KJ10-10 TaxID=3391823 RepID=UPI0039B4FEEA